MTNTIRLELTDTPEKFHPLAEKLARQLVELLRELRTLEQECFAQSIRLCRTAEADRTAGPAEQRDSARARYAALLSPHCTEKLLSQSGRCTHAAQFPSSFNCVDTGCTLAVTIRSPQKAVIRLTPDEGSVPYDLTDPTVCYLAENIRGRTAKSYGYFQKFRFILRREGEAWKLDEISIAGLHETRWKRDFYF